MHQELVSLVRCVRFCKKDISISSPSLFSKIKCLLSLDRCAVTPVLPEKLLIVFAKLVRFVDKTDALIEALLLYARFTFQSKRYRTSIGLGGRAQSLLWRLPQHLMTCVSELIKPFSSVAGW